LAVALAGVLLARPSPASAQPCARLVDQGPLIAGPGSSDFGQVAEACPGDDLFLRLRGELAIDKPDFYGAITAGATLRGRYQLSDRWWFSASLDPATWRMPINAVVSSSGVGFGPGTVGAHRSFAWARTALSIDAQALLPFDTARHYGARWGLEAGAALARQVRRRGSLHLGLTVPATLVALGGRGHASLSPGLLAEYGFAPRPWLALAGGAAARVQAAPSPALSALAARLSARLVTRRGWQYALAGDVPVAGTDRTDLTITFLVGRGWQRPEAR
jgi:hypothetical protein